MTAEEIISHDNLQLGNYYYISKSGWDYGYVISYMYNGIIYPEKERYNNDQYHNHIAKSDIIRKATPKEIKWLKVCLKEDKFISKEYLHKYNDEGYLLEADIDQDELCEYCKDNIYEGDVNTRPDNLCEGSRCEEAKEMYLDDNPPEKGYKFNKGDYVVILDTSLSQRKDKIGDIGILTRTILPHPKEIPQKEELEFTVSKKKKSIKF